MIITVLPDKSIRKCLLRGFIWIRSKFQSDVIVLKMYKFSKLYFVKFENCLSV